MKKLLLGVATLALVAGIGAVAVVQSSADCSIVETKATLASEPEYHKIDGYVNSMGLDWPTEKLTFGTWDDQTKKFSAELLLGTSDWFGFRIGDSSSWIVYSSMDDSTKELFNNVAAIQPKKAGYYRFTWDDTSIHAERIAMRGQDSFVAGDSVYIEPKSEWLLADALIAIHYSGGSDGWSGYLGDSDLTDDAGYWKFTFPADTTATKIQVVRFNPDASSLNPADASDYIWNQSNEHEGDKYYNTIWLGTNNGNPQSDSGGWFAKKQVDYRVKAGDTVADASLYLTDTSKVTASIAVNSNDQIQISNDGGDTWYNAGGENEYANNMTDGGLVKVATTATIYILRSNWEECWLTGYSGETVTLQNFCEYLLAQTTDGSACSVSDDVLSNLKKMYGATYDDANFNLTAADITTFEDASPVYGAVSYESVIQEAKTRYCWLVKGYDMEDFAHINPAAQTIAALPASNNGTSIVVITILGVAFLAMAAGFVFYRKKHQAE